MKEIKGFQGEYRFLSNFYPVDITFEGLKYKSSEAAYQASKSLYEEVKETFTQLSAREARSLGGKIELRPDWETSKLNIMYRILREKFREPNLRGQLLNTGDLYLEETNYWRDTFWGVYNGAGLNYLGRILMVVRDEIREGII